jgi:hypothetical protein
MEHFDKDCIRSRINDSISLDLLSAELIGRSPSEFHGLASSGLEAIPVSVLFHILSHNLLMVLSEDDLFSYISSHICSDPEYFDLLQFVRFQYLSSHCFSSLSAFPDSIDRRLWESISQRLISGVRHEVEFLPTVSTVLDGIISYLTRKHGGNVHDKGIITISSKLIDMTGPQSISDVADLIAGTSFCSEDEPGQWICWDFHEMRIRPTEYTIASM